MIVAITSTYKIKFSTQVLYVVYFALFVFSSLSIKVLLCVLNIVEPNSNIKLFKDVFINQLLIKV